MTEPNTTLGPPAPGSDEQLARVQDALHAQLDAIAAKHEERVLEGIADIITKYDRADTSRVPISVNEKGETLVKTSRAWDSGPERMRLPENERRLRTWDGDHYIRSWLKATQEGDYAGRVQADAKLAMIYPEFYRADTLEGTVGASGAFAGGTGGVLLVRPLEQLVMIALVKIAKMARWARTLTMTAQAHNIPTAKSVTASMQDEATTPAGGEPALAQVQLPAYNAIAKLILGRDLMDDEAANVVPTFVQLAGDALAELEDAEFLKAGTGTLPHVTKLAGVTFVPSPTTATLTFTDVVRMYRLVPQRYRDNARWLVSSDILGMLAGVRDGNGRQLYGNLLDPPQFVGDTASGAPDAGAIGTLFGKPVHEVDLTAGTIYFGDVSRNYVIGRRRGITVEASRDFLFDTRRVIWLISERFGGTNVDTSAGQISVTQITACTSA